MPSWVIVLIVAIATGAGGVIMGQYLSDRALRRMLKRDAGLEVKGALTEAEKRQRAKDDEAALQESIKNYGDEGKSD